MNELEYKIAYPLRYVKSDMVLTDMNDKLICSFNYSDLSVSDSQLLAEEITKLLNLNNSMNIVLKECVSCGWIGPEDELAVDGNGDEILQMVCPKCMGETLDTVDDYVSNHYGD